MLLQTDRLVVLLHDGLQKVHLLVKSSKNGDPIRVLYHNEVAMLA